MNFEVLMSCMNEKDFSLIEKSNLNNVRVLIINQCNSEEVLANDKNMHRMVKTKERGLSRSRNRGLLEAVGDICLLADDDEYFYDNLEEVILEAYTTTPEADIIIFDIDGKQSKLGNTGRFLGKFDLLRVSSVQISFRRKSIKNLVWFDPVLGAGSGNGGGEENKFLLDCYNKGLKIFYQPVKILQLKESESSWFHGFNKEYFYKRGASTRYIYGFIFSLAYGLYFIIMKYSLYKKDISLLNAFIYILKGVFNNNLSKNKGENL